MARYDQDPNFAGMFPTGDTLNANAAGQAGHGSPGIQPVQHSGAVLGTASGSSVMGPGAAFVAPALDEQVGQGDSNSFSDGLAAHSSGITGNVDQAAFMDSNAGKGQVENVHHPNNMWDRS